MPPNATNETQESPKKLKDSLDDPLWKRLKSEAVAVLESEPELGHLLKRTILRPCVTNLDCAIASTVAGRLAGLAGLETEDDSLNSYATLRTVIHDALADPNALEANHHISTCVRMDMEAVVCRDPATTTLLEVVLFHKGYAALVTHRAARHRYRKSLGAGGTGRSFVALWLQSQASIRFGMDIHPACTIGGGVMMDHGTGVVIGETASVGDGCTILHGVTLGGTGREHGDRHPKIGRDVMIGAGTSILGNIKVGDGAKIGAGSVVLRDIPHGVTAVGAPARIIGRSERRPGSKVDAVLRDVPPIIPTTIEGSEENETIEGRDAPLQGNFSLIKSISFENVIDDPLCPFRGLSQASSAAAAKCRKQSLGSSNEILLSHKMVSEEEVENSTPAMISHHTFRCALQEAGMTIPQAGEVFFEMLSDGHGVWEGPGGGGYFRPTQKFWNTLEKYLRTYCPSMDKNHLVDVMTNTKKTRCSEKGSKQEI